MCSVLQSTLIGASGRGSFGLHVRPVDRAARSVLASNPATGFRGRMRALGMDIGPYSCNGEGKIGQRRQGWPPGLVAVAIISFPLRSSIVVLAASLFWPGPKAYTWGVKTIPLLIMCVLIVPIASGQGCGTNPPAPVETCPTQGTSGPSTVSYARQIMPMLTEAGCMASTCHGGTFPSSGYDLRTYDACFLQGDDARR